MDFVSTLSYPQIKPKKLPIKLKLKPKSKPKPKLNQRLLRATSWNILELKSVPFVWCFS